MVDGTSGITTTVEGATDDEDEVTGEVLEGGVLVPDGACGVVEDAEDRVARDDVL